MKVLITGGTSGIGYELALKLVKNGHFVYLCVHNDKEIKTVVDKIKNVNYQDMVSVMNFDVKDRHKRELLRTLDIDCIVLMAAMGVGGSLINMNVSDIRENFDINFFSNLELIKEYIKTRKDKKGKIIVISSLAGIFSIPFLGSYCSTKAALSTFITCLYREIKQSKLNIGLKLIEPGAYKTGFNQVMIDGKNDLNSAFFNEPMDIISEKQRKLFSLIEYKNLSSVVNKIYKAIESNNNKLIYRVPFAQNIFSKLYMLFVK